MKTLHIKDYKHLFVGDDATLALSEALRDAKVSGAEVLSLDGETLHFYKEYAFEREYYVSNNSYSKKSIIFPLMGFENFTVDGEGAELIFHGTVVPFVIDASSGITLKGFTVDYHRPFVMQCTITRAEENYLEMVPDAESMPFRADADGLRFANPDDGWEYLKDRTLVAEFDAATKAPSATIRPYFIYTRKDGEGDVSSSWYNRLVPSTKPDGTICLSGKFDRVHTVGNKLVGSCAPRRECPGIFGNRSKDILIEDVTFFASAAMAIICQVCDNVTLRRVKAIQNEKRNNYLSVSADATHFVNCTGRIEYEDCTFLGMMDDAGNVHGIYYKVHKRIDAHTLILTYGHHEQCGVNVFDKGDAVSVISRKTLQSAFVGTVESAEQLSEHYLRLAVKEELPEITDCDAFALEDTTKYPELYIHGCITGNNRPRGFLPTTTKKVVIENNVFYNMFHALHFEGDANGWFESGAVTDVTVRNNKFINSAYAGEEVIKMSPRVLEGDACYHKNIVIENNEFELADERFLSAAFVENLKFVNNTFHLNDKLTSHGKIGENGITLKNCKGAVIEKVKEI